MTIETQLLEVRAIALAAYKIIQRKKDNEKWLRYPAIFTMYTWYDNDREKYDMAMKIIEQERIKHDKRNRNASAGGRYN